MFDDRPDRLECEPEPNPEFLISGVGLIVRALGMGDEPRCGSSGRCETDHRAIGYCRGRYRFVSAGPAGRMAIIAAHPSTGRGPYAGVPCHIDTRNFPSK